MSGSPSRRGLSPSVTGVTRTAPSRLLALAIASGLALGVAPLSPALAASPPAATAEAATVTLAEAKLAFTRAMGAWDRLFPIAHGKVEFSDEASRVERAWSAVSGSSSVTTVTNYTIGVKKLTATVQKRVHVYDSKARFATVYDAWQRTLAEAKKRNVPVPNTWPARAEAAAGVVSRSTSPRIIDDYAAGVSNFARSMRYRIDNIRPARADFAAAVAAWDAVSAKAASRVDFADEAARVAKAERVVPRLSTISTIRNYAVGVRKLTAAVAQRLDDAR